MQIYNFHQDQRGYSTTTEILTNGKPAKHLFLSIHIKNTKLEIEVTMSTTSLVIIKFRNHCFFKKS